MLLVSLLWTINVICLAFTSGTLSHLKHICPCSCMLLPGHIAHRIGKGCLLTPWLFKAFSLLTFPSLHRVLSLLMFPPQNNCCLFRPLLMIARYLLCFQRSHLNYGCGGCCAVVAVWCFEREVSCECSPFLSWTWKELFSYWRTALWSSLYRNVLLWSVQIHTSSLSHSMTFRHTERMKKNNNLLSALTWKGGFFFSWCVKLAEPNPQHAFQNWRFKLVVQGKWLGCSTYLCVPPYQC